MMRAKAMYSYTLQNFFNSGRLILIGLVAHRYVGTPAHRNSAAGGRRELTTTDEGAGTPGSDLHPRSPVNGPVLGTEWQRSHGTVTSPFTVANATFRSAHVAGSSATTHNHE